MFFWVADKIKGYSLIAFVRFDKEFPWLGQTPLSQNTLLLQATPETIKMAHLLPIGTTLTATKNAKKLLCTMYVIIWRLTIERVFSDSVVGNIEFSQVTSIPIRKRVSVNQLELEKLPVDVLIILRVSWRWLEYVVEMLACFWSSRISRFIAILFYNTSLGPHQ